MVVLLAAVKFLDHGLDSGGAGARQGELHGLRLDPGDPLNQGEGIFILVKDQKAAAVHQDFSPRQIASHGFVEQERRQSAVFAVVVDAAFRTCGIEKQAAVRRRAQPPDI